jgi:hypothetical protein
MRLERTLLLARSVTAFFPACCATAFCHSADAEEGEAPQWWETIEDTVADISEHGKWNLYAFGYAYHNRARYSENALKKLNEKAWGPGIGKTFRNERGNDESLYVIALRDSRKHIQWTAGYSYQWIYRLTDRSLEVGGGFAAGLTRRIDRYHGVPFPTVLPVFSAGTQGAKVMGTYVPRFATTKDRGDVLLLFLRFQL